MECIGSQLGAAAMGRARDLWGGDVMFFVAALALVGVVATWGGLRYFAKSTRLPKDGDDLRRAA
jgi:hypothetical protein